MSVAASSKEFVQVHESAAPQQQEMAGAVDLHIKHNIKSEVDVFNQGHSIFLTSNTCSQNLEMVMPGGAAEGPVTKEHPANVCVLAMGDPQLPAGKICPIPPDGLCFYNCTIAAHNVESYMTARDDKGNPTGAVSFQQARGAIDKKRALDLKRRMHKLAVLVKDKESSARLAEGSADYPTSHEIKYAAAAIGGAIHEINPLVDGHPVFQHGFGGVALCIQYVQVKDGAGHMSDHWDLAQYFCLMLDTSSKSTFQVIGQPKRHQKGRVKESTIAPEDALHDILSVIGRTGGLVLLEATSPVLFGLRRWGGRPRWRPANDGWVAFFP